MPTCPVARPGPGPSCGDPAVFEIFAAGLSDPYGTVSFSLVVVKVGMGGYPGAPGTGGRRRPCGVGRDTRTRRDK
ncbi:hypothetical protein GALLR39Z86_08160 [Glycomyces algeriensis]|uniref:Uncharacterized protein n=1 Tax=Glycomyces algeriensis TaxID=256037 RepID=A0A9W6LFU6_9ACTN|nr:hypothetical protein GALLR39Z86_08160 [Glycomyces algeriensis]